MEMTSRTSDWSNHSMRLILACFLLFGALIVASSQVHASPVRWTCNCDPGSTEIMASCSCPYSYQLKKLGTKEFRAYCGHAVKDRTVAPSYENVHRDKNVTCTVAFHSPSKPGYLSKSCTNWNATHKRSVSMSIKCEVIYRD